VDLETLTKNIMHNSSALNLFDDSELNETTYVYICLSNCINELVEKNTIDEIIKKRDELIKVSEREFIHILDERNQFYSFSSVQKIKIQKVYMMLINDIYQKITSSNLDLENLIIEHRKRLQCVFNSPVSKKPCSYYDAKIQIDILEIDIQKLVEPIIDVGCGKNANMVMYLDDKGYSVFGIDRYCEIKSDKIESVSWDDFVFKKNYWGTVISHMAFSNHFIYHYLKNDSVDYQYAIKYKEILDSIRKMGSFYYTPSLPFIEKYLDKQEYKIEYSELKKVGITHITKL
jgi:hypothetical protein